MVDILPADHDASRAAAAEALLAGKLVILPTDTVYGVGCLPRRSSVERIYRAKHRPSSKPVPLLVSSVALAKSLLPDMSTEVFSLGSVFWPGPLTIVVPAPAELAAALGSADRTAAVRVPGHRELRAVIDACGGALAVSSANLSGQGECRSALEAVRQLGDEVALALDGGPPAGAPSTVVDMTGPEPVILRSGALDASILAFLADLQEHSGEARPW